MVKIRTITSKSIEHLKKIIMGLGSNFAHTLKPNSIFVIALRLYVCYIFLLSCPCQGSLEKIVECGDSIGLAKIAHYFKMFVLFFIELESLKFF